MPAPNAMKADEDAVLELDAEYFKQIAAYYIGNLERSRKNAEAVSAAASAIAVIYAGVLGVTFSVTDRPLPARGAWPAVFLGLAIVLATAYRAFWTHARPVDRVQPDGNRSLAARVEYRQSQVSRLMRAAVLERVTLLRLACVALGLGAAMIAFPFLDLDVSDPQAAPAQLTDWPALPDVETDAEASVAAIRYEAEVNEVAAARAIEQSVATVPRTFGSGIEFEWATWAAVVGLASMAVIGVWSMISVSRAKKELTDGAGTPATG